MNANNLIVLCFVSIIIITIILLLLLLLLIIYFLHLQYLHQMKAGVVTDALYPKFSGAIQNGVV